MIYLIGGAPRCGKTILAKKISIKKKISWITTDALRPVILAYVSKKERNNKFPYEALKINKNQYHFERYSPTKLLRAEIKEAYTMWPGLRALIQQLINCKQNYIIEGVHLLPQLINQFKNTRYWKNIEVIYLVKKDLNKIVQGLNKNKREFDWLSQGIKNKDNLIKATKLIKTESDYFVKETRRYKLKVINTDTDFIKKINKYSKF